MMHPKQIFSGLLVSALAFATPALSQDSWSLAGGIELKLKQLFEIETSGLKAANTSEVINELGTGFAIAPNLVITAGHVTRNRMHFKNIVRNDKIHIPDRDIVLTYAEGTGRRDDTRDIIDTVVTPSPVSNTDAALIELIASGDVAPLPLSICAIQPAQEYFLLKFSQDRGGAKDSNLPVAVPISSTGDVADRLGNLWRFEHNIFSRSSTSLPMEGDSGAPIVDQTGHVVGLLTAVEGDNSIWVTPTLAFFDLVPPSVRRTVKCNDNVEVVTLQLNDTNKQLDILAENLRVATDVVAELERKLAQQSDLIASLTASHEAHVAEMAQTVQDLRSKDAELEKISSDIEGDLNRSKQRSAAVLAAMVMSSKEHGTVTKENLQDAITYLQEADPEVTQQLVERALQHMAAAKPVIPAVQRMDDQVIRMTKDLGEPDWYFWHSFAVQQTPNQPYLNVVYRRELTLPVISNKIKVCLRPMLEFSANAKRRSRLGYVNYADFDFYAASEETVTTDSELLTHCSRDVATNPRLDEAKTASYLLQLDLDREIEENADPNLTPPDRDIADRVEWVYGYIVDEQEIERDRPEQAVLHRLVFSVRYGNGDIPEISCYYFPEKTDESDENRRVSNTLDTLAKFGKSLAETRRNLEEKTASDLAKANEAFEESRNNHECPTL